MTTNWAGLTSVLSPEKPKVSGWAQAGSILGLIGGVIAKTSKDKKTQSIGKALAAAGSIPGAIHNPGLADQKGIGKEVVEGYKFDPKIADSIWWGDGDGVKFNFNSLNLNPNTQFNPIPLDTNTKTKDLFPIN